MKHIHQLAAIVSVSALGLFGCQSPVNDSSNTQATQATQTQAATASSTASTSSNTTSNAVRTLNDVTCNDQSVNLDLNQGGVVQQGTLKGYNYCEYQIPLKAGQHLNVNFDTPSTGAYVIVFDRTDLSDVALTTDGYTANTDEVLPVRVLLTRNKARSNEQVPFKVQFNLN